MGRPLNKRFFASGTGTTVGCSYHDGSSVVESAIISQKSNTRYRVAGGGGTPLTGTSLAFAEANPDTITASTWADLTLTFAAGDQFRVASSENTGENDGVYTIATVNATVITITLDGDFVANADDTTATLALVAPNGVVGTLVQGAPNALGEMQVTVTPELLAASAEMQIDFGTTGGIVDEVSIVDAGSGYFTGGTFQISVASDGGYVAGAEAVITYTVANQVVTSVVVTSGGSGYTSDLVNTTNVNTADLPDAVLAGDEESAKIINARTVKTFEGNIYMWPAVGGTGTPKVRNEADLQSSDL